MTSHFKPKYWLRGLLVQKNLIFQLNKPSLILCSFGKSLQYGCRHIYQSMPRMLGLWLEFGTRVSELEAKEEKSRVSRKNSTLDSHREKLANLNGAVGM